MSIICNQGEHDEIAKALSVQIAKADAATRRANDLARGGLARPGGSPAKGTARIEDVRAAARLKGKNIARVVTRVKP